MTNSDIISRRLFNQQIGGTRFTKPEQVVKWMVAMQSQAYAMAKWAIGLRLPGSTDEQVEKAFNEGKILRTHVLRPTWHFVRPEDIRWLIELSAPRVQLANNYMAGKLGLTNKIFKRSNDVIGKLLENEKQLDRNAIRLALDRAKIATNEQRLIHLLFRAELDGIICSGPRQGNQFTYALLDSKAPPMGTFDRQKAVATLCKRYFASRGPATVQDFVWWSGLTMQDAREGLSIIQSKFRTELIDGRQYIFPENNHQPVDRQTFLSPDYDEYAISYKNREVIFKHEKLNPESNPIFSAVLIVDGRMAGTWKRIVKNKELKIETHPIKPLDRMQKAAVAEAVKRYLAFISAGQTKPKEK